MYENNYGNDIVDDLQIKPDFCFHALTLGTSGLCLIDSPSFCTLVE